MKCRWPRPPHWPFANPPSPPPPRRAVRYVGHQQYPPPVMFSDSGDKGNANCILVRGVATGFHASLPLPLFSVWNAGVKFAGR